MGRILFFTLGYPSRPSPCLVLEVGPLNAARRCGGAPLQGGLERAELQPKSDLVAYILAFKYDILWQQF